MFWIFKKLSNMFLTLFGVITIIFFLFNVLPGDPAQMMLDQNENTEQLEMLKKKYGFDKPVFIQYLNDPSHLTHIKKDKYNFIKFLSFENSDVIIKTPYLRESYQKNGMPVIEIIKNTFPNTAVLALSSITIAIIIGMLLGILSALNKNNFIDYITLV